MELTAILADAPATGFTPAWPPDRQIADLVMAQHLEGASQGDLDAMFELGVTFSTDAHGVAADLIEAHKWFNLAAVAGHEEAKTCRADIAGEMTMREIAEAQRRAREWIAAGRRR